MADLKISQLTGATTPLAGTEVLPIVQSSATKKVATDDLTVKNVRSNATTGILQIAGPGAGTTRTMTTPNANFSAARIDAAQTFSGVQTYLGGATAGTNNVLAVYSDNTYPNSGLPTIRFDGFGAGNGYSGAIYGTQYGGVVIAAANTFGGTYVPVLTALNGTLDVNIASGNIVPSTAAKGVNFTANTSAAGMTSQLLNWYEEGTWTPVLEAENGAFGAITYNALNGGRYVRVGDMVHVQALFYTDSVAAGTASLEVRLAGLPFTAVASTGSTQDGFSSLAISQSSGWVNNQPSGAFVRANSKQINLTYRATANGGTATMNVNEVTTGSTGNLVRFSGTYFCA